MQLVPLRRGGEDFLIAAGWRKIVEKFEPYFVFDKAGAGTGGDGNSGSGSGGASGNGSGSGSGGGSGGGAVQVESSCPIALGRNLVSTLDLETSKVKTRFQNVLSNGSNLSGYAAGGVRC
jgi:hypothetical protein